MRKSSDLRDIEGTKMGVSSISRCLSVVGGGVWREEEEGVLRFVRDGDLFGFGVCEVVFLAIKLGRSDMCLSLAWCRVLSSTDGGCNMDIIPLSRALRRSCSSSLADCLAVTEV